jgi:8-oxo-dGTP pyrophosphatase MutT (NUDIX family)
MLLYDASKLLVDIDGKIMMVLSENIGWTLPGGKREYYETDPVVTLLRELDEEIPGHGLNRRDLVMPDTYDEGGYVTKVFSIKRDVRFILRLTPAREIRRIKTMTPKEIRKKVSYWNRFFKKW